MDWNDLKVLIDTYYPVVIAGILTVSSVLGVAYVAYKKAKLVVQPVLDFLKKKDKDEEVAKVKNSVLENIKSDTLKLDLQAKIDNTTVSEDLRKKYQLQLDRLNSYEEQANSVIAKVEETLKF